MLQPYLTYRDIPQIKTRNTKRLCKQDDDKVKKETESILFTQRRNLKSVFRETPVEWVNAICERLEISHVDSHTENVAAVDFHQTRSTQS